MGGSNDQSTQVRKTLLNRVELIGLWLPHFFGNSPLLLVTYFLLPAFEVAVGRDE